jgi:hypothetical protein
MTKPSGTLGASPLDVCEQFCRFADRIHGTYLDATMGMGGMSSWYMKMDRERWKEFEQAKESFTWDVFNPEIVYGGTVRGKQGELHRTRLHDIIARNSPGGSNWVFLALMCVVGLYQIWDEHFRGALAQAMGMKSDELRADIFGELRHLRNSIIHRQGYASAEVAQAKLTRAFPEDTPIVMEPQDLHDITDLVKEAAREVVRDHPRAA